MGLVGGRMRLERTGGRKDGKENGEGGCSQWEGEMEELRIPETNKARKKQGGRKKQGD